MMEAIRPPNFSGNFGSCWNIASQGCARCGVRSMIQIWPPLHCLLCLLHESVELTVQPVWWHFGVTAFFHLRGERGKKLSLFLFPSLGCSQITYFSSETNIFSVRYMVTPQLLPAWTLTTSYAIRIMKKAKWSTRHLLYAHHLLWKCPDCNALFLSPLLVRLSHVLPAYFTWRMRQTNIAPANTYTFLLCTIVCGKTRKKETYLLVGKRQHYMENDIYKIPSPLSWLVENPSRHTFNQTLATTCSRILVHLSADAVHTPVTCTQLSNEQANTNFNTFLFGGDSRI